MAVHLTGTAELIELTPSLLHDVEAETARTYDAFRTPAAAMPSSTARHDATTMRWVRFTADERILSWSNAELTTAPASGAHATTRHPGATT